MNIPSTYELNKGTFQIPQKFVLAFLFLSSSRILQPTQRRPAQALARARVASRVRSGGVMPAPPYLLGLSAGVSLTAIAKAASELSSKGESRKVKSSKTPKQKPLIVKPKPFVRVPPESIPADPCPECDGYGKCMCDSCLGRGRTNFPDQAMLPRGVSPDWCEYCRGSGRVNCGRCQGMGNFRAKIGFDVMSD